MDISRIVPKKWSFGLRVCVAGSFESRKDANLLTHNTDEDRVDFYRGIAVLGLANNTKSPNLYKLNDHFFGMIREISIPKDGIAKMSDVSTDICL